MKLLERDLPTNDMRNVMIVLAKVEVRPPVYIERCHRVHNIGSMKDGQFFCDCALKPFHLPAEQNVSTSETHEDTKMVVNTLVDRNRSVTEKMMITMGTNS